MAEHGRSGASGRGEWGTSSASRMVATFTDYDDPHAPYDGRAIQISLTGDVLFIYPGTLKEDQKQTTFEHGDNAIGVDAEAFYEALGSMLRREDRIAHERAAQGKTAGLEPLLTSMPTVIQVPATRRRA